MSLPSSWKFSVTAEQHVVSADVQTVCVVDFQWFYTLAVLLSVRVDGSFGQSKVLEVERVVSATAGKCVVSDESHDMMRVGSRPENSFSWETS